MRKDYFQFAIIHVARRKLVIVILKGEKFITAFNFIVSDTDEQNRPVNMNDLENRINEIKDLIPQPLTREPGNNMRFAEKAFTLFKDCGLINKKNLELLNDPRWCQNNFGVGMNPLGGVLRREDLPMWDKTNLRYYCPREDLTDPDDIYIANRKQWNGASRLAIVCDGVKYYISNDWFSDDKPRPTKGAFVEKLSKWAIRACKFETPDAPKIPDAPKTPVNDLKAVLAYLEELNKKVDALNEKIDEANKDIKALKEAWMI